MSHGVAYPAYCPGQDRQFLTKEEAEAHYVALGFRLFDGDSEWLLMYKGVLEVYIRRMNRLRVGWHGSMVQTGPGQCIDCDVSMGTPEYCYCGIAA